MEDKTLITDSQQQNTEKNYTIYETGIIHLDFFSF